MRTTRPFWYGLSASLLLLGVYFLILSALSKSWLLAYSQFSAYWYFIVSLAVGFGVQVGLYQYIKYLVRGGKGMKAVVGVTGTTSTAAMVSCCTHYLVNLLPILGITGLATFVAQYQVKLFWAGIVFNLAGISYMVNRIFKIKKT